ncbi:hypothetical protein MKW98_022789 [Papaver atlanticum]|uniref:Uncharacterized protein n=1 Tax=Papaver atlanticum TaxID=357466 RepID=A0AAD4TLP6_9MAGN|nr:hypothetical protein MKW98_022789 [Papaver atlanticum]
MSKYSTRTIKAAHVTMMTTVKSNHNIRLLKRMNSFRKCKIGHLCPSCKST